MKQGIVCGATRWSLLLALALAVAASPAEAKIVKTYRLQIGSLNDSAAAEALRRRAVEKTPLPVFVEEIQGLYKVTAGDFSTYQDATAYKDRLYGEGFEGAFVVEVLSSVADSAKRVYKVQVGNFGSLVNARQLQSELRQRQVTDVTIDRVGGFYKVRVGHYPSSREAATDLRILQNAGYPDAWIAEAGDEKALLRRQLISMVPASQASLEATEADLRPESLEENVLYQVVLGPYTQQILAEEIMQDLLRQSFAEVRLVPSGGNFFLEVDSPSNPLQADGLRRTLSEKGFLNATVREIAQPTAVKAPRAVATPEPEQIAMEQPRPETREAAPEGESPERMAEAHLRTAERLMEQGHYEAARDQYQTALRYAPEHSRVQEGLTASLNAIREQQRVSQQAGMDLLLASAKKLTELGEHRAAAIQLRQVLQINPTHEEALAALAEVNQSLEQALAEKPVEGAAPPEKKEGQPSKPDPAQPILEQCDQALAQGNLPQAKALLQQGLKQHPGHSGLQDKLRQVNRRIAQRQARAAQAKPPEDKGWGILGLLFILLLAIVAIGGAGAAVYFFVIRRRSTPKPAKSKAPVQGKIKILGAKPAAKSAKKKPVPEEIFPEPLIAPETVAEVPEPEPEAIAQEPEVTPEAIEEPPESAPELETVSQEQPPTSTEAPWLEDEKQLLEPAPAAEESPAQPEPEREIEPEPMSVSEPAPESETPPEPPVAKQEPPAVEPAPAVSEPERVSEPETVSESEPVAPEAPEPESAPAEPSAEEPEEVAVESPGPIVVFEQAFNEYESGDRVENWKGEYEVATLTVSQNRLIAGEEHYLKFVKEPCAEEVLYCALVPESGRKPTFEFDLCCLGVNEYPIGLHLESVENESLSLAVDFKTDSETQEIQLSVGEKSLPYASGDWRHVRFEIDLDARTFNVQIDGETAVSDESLPGETNSIDLVSLKAAAETEGTLLMNHLKVVQN